MAYVLKSRASRSCHVHRHFHLLDAILDLATCITMLDSSRASTSLKLVLSLLVFGCSLYYFGFLELSAGIGDEDEKSLFVDSFLESEADGDFDGEPIASLCSAKNWTEGMVFNCDAPSGGIGVVRNVHLNCIRFAIEAGGQSAGKTTLGFC